MANIAIFFDGTWNNIGTNTNVWRLYSAVAEKDSEGARQKVYYDIGVNGVLGGLLGKGVSKNIFSAYQWLTQNYTLGDKIFIFGFSRGAYTARCLSGLIAKYGILKRGVITSTNQLFQFYKDKKTSFHQLKNSMQSNSEFDNLILEDTNLAEIEMVGVWDTVGSIGIPNSNLAMIGRNSFQWQDTGLRKLVKHAFQALAIDEFRKDFDHTPWTARSDKQEPIRPIEQVEQRWFTGNHGNVGGGYFSDPLTSAPFEWLKSKAIYCGLSFIETRVALVNELAIVDSRSEFMFGLYKYISPKNLRKIMRAPYYFEDRRQVTINETIDDSVFELMRQHVYYRPSNIMEYLEKKSCKLENASHKITINCPILYT